jgi:hypothetical protein
MSLIVAVVSSTVASQLCPPSVLRKTPRSWVPAHSRPGRSGSVARLITPDGTAPKGIGEVALHDAPPSVLRNRSPLVPRTAAYTVCGAEGSRASAETKSFRGRPRSDRCQDSPPSIVLITPAPTAPYTVPAAEGSPSRSWKSGNTGRAAVRSDHVAPSSSLRKKPVAVPT